MTNVEVVASKVSSHVLNMQFMKKTAIKIEEEKAKKNVEVEAEKADNDPESRVYSTVQTINDLPTCSLKSVLNEERFSVLENLRFGRFSYHGQNEEVEKLMIYHECKRLGKELPEEILDLENVEEDKLNMEEFDEEEQAYLNKAFVKRKRKSNQTDNKKQNLKIKKFS